MKESMAYGESVPMSEVSSVKAMHQNNHQVHTLTSSASCSTSRNNLYDKSLNSTPKECLYFSCNTPANSATTTAAAAAAAAANAISSSSTDHLHHHTHQYQGGQQHHHLHHQLQLHHHHAYQTPSKSDQMTFHLSQQQHQINDCTGESGANLADIYIASSPMHPGQFRVAGAGRSNYEVPFILAKVFVFAHLSL